MLVPKESVELGVERPMTRHLRASPWIAIVGAVLGSGCEQADSPQAVEPGLVKAAPTPTPRPTTPTPTPTPTTPPIPDPWKPTVDTPWPPGATVTRERARELGVPAPRRPITSAKRWFLALSREQRRDVTEICRQRAIDPCAGLLPRPRDAGPDPIVALFAGLSSEQADGVEGYCRQVNRGSRGCDTPLVIAFDAQPIVFTPASADRFAFTAGDPVATDWPTAQTPWIALDRDGDGAISSGAELFGDASVLPGGATARNGFVALAALDANRDGTIDRDDPAFAALLLWADHNGDHASSPDELRPLASVVISIPLAYRPDARCNDRHDCEGERGMVRWRDPSGSEHAGAVVDVYLPRR